MSDITTTDKEKLLRIVNKLQAFIDDPEEHFFYVPIKESMRRLDTQKSRCRDASAIDYP